MNGIHDYGTIIACKEASSDIAALGALKPSIVRQLELKNRRLKNRWVKVSSCHEFIKG